MALRLGRAGGAGDHQFGEIKKRLRKMEASQPFSCCRQAKSSASRLYRYRSAVISTSLSGPFRFLFANSPKFSVSSTLAAGLSTSMNRTVVDIFLWFPFLSFYSRSGRARAVVCLTYRAWDGAILSTGGLIYDQTSRRAGMPHGLLRFAIWNHGADGGAFDWGDRGRHTGG